MTNYYLNRVFSVGWMNEIFLLVWYVQLYCLSLICGEHVAVLQEYDDSSSFTAGELDNLPKFQLDPFHSDYIYFVRSSYKTAGLLRVALEKRVQEELNARAAGGTCYKKDCLHS